MTRCRITVALAVAAALALGACSSTTSGQAVSGSSGPAGSRAASSTSARGASNPATAATPEGLAATLRQGLASTRSAHITLRITTGGQSITGSGDETLSDGKLSGLDLTETIPGVGVLRLIQLDGKTYAKLPASLNTSSTPSKPWILVTTASTNPTIKALATSLQSAQSTAVDSAGVFAMAAKSIANRGPTTVQGVQATHYAIVVDVAKLPTNYAGRSALTQAGITTLPIDLYVDSSGRPVQVSEQLTVAGKSVSTVAGVTKYNEPVTIKAPPASEIGTG